MLVPYRCHIVPNAGAGVGLISFPMQQGKSAIQNGLVAAASGEVEMDELGTIGAAPVQPVSPLVCSVCSLTAHSPE